MTLEPKVEGDQIKRVAVVVRDHQSHAPRVRGRR
jgi:hypothetical protein